LVLQTVVEGRATIFCQVAMRQLLYLPGSNQSNPGRQSWQNRLGAKSIDFLLCDPKTLRPLLAIELDDATHAQARRQTRDEHVDALLEAAGLPFLRVLASRQYDVQELRATVLPHVQQAVRGDVAPASRPSC
jgi:very-short-patch-repair endonuclease